MEVIFDTLEMVKKLEEKGLSREQAEEIIAIIKDLQSDLVTTKSLASDLKELELRMTVRVSSIVFALLLAFKVFDKFF
jgi:hypothetical protein